MSTRALLPLLLAITGCGSGTIGAMSDAGVGAADAARCSFPPGAIVGPMVRIVYLVPSDREENPAYTAALESAARHVQLWFRDNTSEGLSFPVHEPVVEVVRSTRPASYYRDSATDGEEKWRFWQNATEDAFALTSGGTSTGSTTWLYYVDADPACGQVGAASSGTAALVAANDLRGLAGEATVPICPGDEPSDAGRCRWVGGLAYFIATVAGIPPCPAGEAGCPASHLRSNFFAYPEVELADGDEDVLAAGGQFRQVILPRCSLDCAAP